MVDVPTTAQFDELAARVTALEQLVTETPPPIEPPQPTTGMQAHRIVDTVGTFGVNTFSSLDEHNTWGSWPADYRPEQVIGALDYMTKGTGHAFRIREYHYHGKQASQRTWLEQIQAAIPNTLVTMCVGANGSVADVPSMLSMSDRLAWVEGLNEPNTDFGSGMVPVDRTMDIQHQLWDGAPESLVVMGPSIVAGMPHPEGWIVGYFGPQMEACNNALDRGNGHYYPPHCPDLIGDGTALTEYVGGLWQAYGQHLIDITEFHPTLFNGEGNGPGQAGWDGNRDSYYTLLALLRSADCGVKGIWWYALFDYGTTYTCGLFPQRAENPRQAATVLRRLCQTCPDTGATARTFAPGKLDVQIALGERCYAHLCQASNRTWYLFLWHSENEPGGAPQVIGISFATAVALTEHDLLSGESTWHAAASLHSITLPATVRVLAFTT